MSGGMKEAAETQREPHTLALEKQMYDTHAHTHTKYTHK